MGRKALKGCLNNSTEPREVVVFFLLLSTNESNLKSCHLKYYLKHLEDVDNGPVILRIWGF